MSAKPQHVFDNDALQDSLAQDSHRSQIANDIARLKNQSLRALSIRGRLPQPLFWSLFNCEIKRLRRKKEQREMLKELLD